MHFEKHTQESKKIIGLKAKLMWQNLEIRKKIINTMKGRIAHNKGVWIEKKCPVCYSFFSYPIYLDKKVCAKKCMYLFRKGKSNSNKGKIRPQTTGAKNGMWKGGVRRTYNERARQLLKNNGVDITNKDVHHIDGDWKNNSIDNLIALTREDHLRYHRNKDGLRPINKYEQRLRRNLRNGKD